MLLRYGRVSVVSRSDVLSGAWRPFVGGAAVCLSAVCSVVLFSPYDHPGIAASRNAPKSAFVAVSYIWCAIARLLASGDFSYAPCGLEE